MVLYRAGRTTAGKDASASHTASMAGDFEVTRDLAAQAGVLVAESLEEFHDLLALTALLDGRSVGDGRLGALSNAGPPPRCRATAVTTRSPMNGSSGTKVIAQRPVVGTSGAASTTATSRDHDWPGSGEVTVTSSAS